MAKKRKKVVKNSNSNSNSKAKSLEISGTFESPRAEARQNVMRARSFGPFDFAVKDNREVLDKDFTLEVDLEGQPTEESMATLREAAKVILSANFCKKSKADERRGWLQASWSTSPKAQRAGLDPHEVFEVGVAKSRRPDPQRAKLAEDLVQLNGRLNGLGLTPDQEGDQLDIPGMGILYTSDLVTVTRGGNDLALCSFVEGLFKSESSIKQWAKLTPAEQKELEALKAEEARKAAQAQQADDAFAAFTKVAQEEEAKVAEEERLAEEKRIAEEMEARRAAWTMLCLDSDLQESWAEMTSEANQRWEEARTEVEMVKGVVRPGKPRVDAIKELYKTFSPAAFNAIASWVKDTYQDRTSLSQSINLAREAFPRGEGVEPFVSDRWFDTHGEEIPKLADTLEEYQTQEDWRLAALGQLPEAQVVEFEQRLEEVYSEIQKQPT